MMQTIINKLSPVLLALLLFASCDKNEYSMEQHVEGDGEKIRFEIAVGTATATTSGVRTRVATSTDGNYTSTFSNGDAIGVYIVKGSGGLQSSGNWVDNMKMTYNNGNWTYTFPSGKGYYPVDGDKLNFYAYYPYKTNVPDALNMSIVGITDQSTAVNLSKSDVLHASRLNVGKSSNPVQLTFSHAMAMVELKVNSGAAGATMSSQVTVTTEVCIPDASFNLSTGAASATGGSKSVKMYRVEQPGDADYYVNYTYRVLVPTQTVPATSELFRFSQTQGTITRTLSHKPVSGVALWPGQVKPYEITLQGVSSTHTYAVGDYYPHKGFPILGIVFETSNGGVNGKIISMDEAIEVKWGNSAIDELLDGVSGIRDTNNGSDATKNMITLRHNQADFSSFYQVFDWIYQTKNQGDVNGKWYLPANDELTAFRNVWNTDRTGFSAKLTAAGYDEIWQDCNYRSSTESDLEYAYFIQMNFGSLWSIWYNKEYSDWSFRARAVAKF